MHFPGTVHTSLENTAMKPQQRYLMLRRKHPVMTALLQDCRLSSRLSLTSGIKREGRLRETNELYHAIVFVLRKKAENYSYCWQQPALHTGVTPCVLGPALWIIAIRAPLARAMAVLAVAVGVYSVFLPHLLCLSPGHVWGALFVLLWHPWEWRKKCSEDWNFMLQPSRDTFL